MTVSQRTTNKLGASLLLAVVRGEITAAAAKAAMSSKDNKHVRLSSCKVGAHGVCVAHGQPITECEH